MFLIAIDKSGCLLVEQTVLGTNGNPYYLACLPTILDNSSREDVTNWLMKAGANNVSVIAFFDTRLSTRSVSSKYVVCSVSELRLHDSKFELKSLNLLWKQEIDV